MPEMSKKGRILVFSTSYAPMIGGAEIAIHELTSRVLDYDFDLITSNELGIAKYEQIGRVGVYRVGPKGKIGKLLLPFLGVIKAWKLHKRNHYVLFWAVMASFASGIPYIVNIKRKLLGRKPVPIILTLQEGDSEEHISKKRFGLINLSWKLSIPRSNHITVISNYLEKRAREFGYKGGVSLVPNGAEVKRFSQEFDRPVLKNFREDLHKKDGDVFLVTTSRLVKKNAVGDVIKALKLLPVNIKFLVLGDGELKGELVELANSMGVNERVNFLGSIPNSEIVKYLKVSDIFIRPSLSEGQGISFIEAMAAGLPIIATKVGGIPDFLVDEETGLFVKTNSPEDISVKVHKLVVNVELKKKISNNVREVAQNYDWDLIAPKMELVFDKYHAE